MKTVVKALVSVAGAGAAATAVAGLINLRISGRAPSLGPALDAPFSRYDWDGGRVGYYHSGKGRPMLLLHSHNAAASAWEWKRVYPLLAARYEVFVPDLPGYGRSERRAREYQDHTYIRFIHDFVRDVIGEPAIVVASSVSAAQALVATAEDDGLFTHVVCVSPTGLAEETLGPPRFIRPLGEALKWPVWGQALYNGIASRRYIRRTYERQVYYDPKALTDDEVEYAWVTSHQPNARYAPSGFLNGDLWPDARAAYAGLRRPCLVVWGQYDGFNTRQRSEAGMKQNPSVKTETVPDCGSTPHAEQPAAFVSVLERFLSASGD
jgi:pimeloyl-ACP methyl ester carboxylesterase